MCRLAAWSGPPRPLSALTHDPPHALVQQAWAPRQMIDARLNADGAGVAWYPDDGTAAPALYRTLLPLWSDESLASLAPRIRARMIVAVVRSATPGLPVSPAATPPFVHGPLTFAHNGYLERFHSVFMRPLRERLSDEAYATVTGGTDSEHVFALILDALRDGTSLEEAARRAVNTCLYLAQESGVKAALNLMVTDGHVMVATRACQGGPAPTLFLRAGDGVTLASEPLDDGDGWQAFDERSLALVGEGGRVDWQPL